MPPCRRFHGAAGISLAALLLLAPACERSTSPTAPVVPEPPRPTLRLVVLTDLQGTLEPCGCTSRPLGGIDRTAALLERLRAEGVPVLAVEAGDFLFGGAHPGPEGAITQALWRARTLLEIAREDLQLAAVTPGAGDFAHGLGVLDEALEGRGDQPAWLAAGVERLGEEGSRSHGFVPVSSKRVDVSGVPLGLVGVTSAPAAGGEAIEVAADPLEAGAEAVRALRAAGARVVIGLIAGDRRLARDAAARLGADLLVQGGLDREEPAAPTARAGVTILNAGRQGQGIVVADLHVRDAGAFADASAWTREAERDALRAEADGLAERIAAWEASGDDSEEVASQRERLTAMRARIEGLAAPPPIPEEGNVLVARYVEVAPELAPAAAATERMRDFDRRINEHNRTAFAELRPLPPPPGAPSYVGSAACAACHEEAHAWWEGHPHGRAYATLQARFKEYSFDCVGCHVTGYGRPGGSTVTHHLDGALTNVGCESCHGPGSQHAEDPEREGPVFGVDVPEDVCRGCHNEEHSDLFEYSAYRAALRAPGHGLPTEER